MLLFPQGPNHILFSHWDFSLSFEYLQNQSSKFLLFSSEFPIFSLSSLEDSSHCLWVYFISLLLHCGLGKDIGLYLFILEFMLIPYHSASSIEYVQ